MKYFILITTLIATSTNLLIAMEDQHTTKTGLISNTDRDNLSVTLINKSGIRLWIEIGDLDRDEIRCRKPFRSKEKFVLFPYSKSFYRKDEYPENGPCIKLFMAYPEDNIKNILLFTKDSKVQFGDTVDITYNNNELHLARFNHNNTNALNSMHPHDENEVTLHSKLSKQPSYDKDANASNDTHHKRHSIRLHMTRKPTK